MRWLRGSALFLAGTLVGILIMATAASSQKKMTGLTLNHFGIYVNDMDESTKYYTEKMGFHESFRFKDGTGHPIVYLQIDRNTFLELTPADKDHPAGLSHGGILSNAGAVTSLDLPEQRHPVEDGMLRGTKTLISTTTHPNGHNREVLSH